MNLEKRINPDNLIYKYKIEGISPKDFINYQNLIELFKDLRDDNINLKEVLKDEINFKSVFREIKKKRNPNAKSKHQISVTQNFEKCFDLREKIIYFLPIALAQVKAGNTSENLLDEISIE